MTVVAQLLVPHSSWPEHWSSASQSPSPSPHSLDTQYVAHHSLDTIELVPAQQQCPHLVSSLPQHPSPPRQYMLRLAAAVVVIMTSSALEPTSGSSR